MGLRNCVDAWGVPVKREGFPRPSLTESARQAGTNNSAKPSATPIKSAKPVSAPPVPLDVPAAPRGRGRPKAIDAAPWEQVGVSRRTYYRQQAKARASGVEEIALTQAKAKDKA